MKNLPIYILGLLFSVYVMVMYTEPYFYLVVLVLMALGILSVLSGVYMRQHITVSLKAPQSLVYAGNTLALTFLVSNRGFLPVNHMRVRLDYKNKIGDLAKNQWICLYGDSRKDAHVTVHLESQYCGMLSFSLSRFRISDYLSLWRFYKKCEQILEIPVFPVLFPLSCEISAKIRDFIGESDIYSKDKSGDDPSEVFDVRAFRPGDRMQRIHWKLTARSDDFVVKEFSRPVGYPVVVFFNFSRLKEGSMAEAISQVITAGLSLSAALARASCWHYLAWCGKDMEVRRCSIESEEDVYANMGYLLYAVPHVPVGDARDFYGRIFGFESFCTFLSVSTDRTIEKDGEIIEERGLDRDTLSGKNFIL